MSPDNKTKMWRVACNWHGMFFQTRLLSRPLHMVTRGLWCYPALVIHDKEVCWFHVMLQTQRIDGKHRLKLYPPTCTAITEAGGPTLLKYVRVDCGNNPGWKDTGEPIGQYPTKRMGDMTVDEFTAAESGLALTYDDAVNEFGDTGQLPPDFVTAYKRITHPAFKSYLKFLVPDFADQVWRTD